MSLGFGVVQLDVTHRQHRGVPFDVAKVVSFLASTTVASSPEAKSS
jgi:hypothetical protein